MTGKQQPNFDPSQARRTLVRYTMLLFAGVAALVLAAIQLFGYQAVRDSWDAATPWVTAVKWSGLAVLIWRWDAFVRWAAGRWNMSEAYRDYLAALRWRVAAMLAVLELLFGQNLAAHILN